MIIIKFIITNKIATATSGLPAACMFGKPFPPPLNPKLSKNPNANITKDENFKNSLLLFVTELNKKLKKTVKKIKLRK